MEKNPATLETIPEKKSTIPFHTPTMVLYAELNAPVIAETMLLKMLLIELSNPWKKFTMGMITLLFTHPATVLKIDCIPLTRELNRETTLSTREVKNETTGVTMLSIIHPGIAEMKEVTAFHAVVTPVTIASSAARKNKELY